MRRGDLLRGLVRRGDKKRGIYRENANATLRVTLNTKVSHVYNVSMGLGFYEAAWDGVRI